MKPFIAVLFILSVLAVPSFAEEPLGMLTIRLTGNGAVMGRLTVMEFPMVGGPTFINCPFDFQDNVYEYSPVREEDTTCERQVHLQSWIEIMAPTATLTSPGGEWKVDFSSFSGSSCLTSPHAGAGPTNICSFSMIMSTADVSADFTASSMPQPTPTVTPTSTPTATPTATPDPQQVNQQYLQGSSGMIASKLATQSIKKLAAAKSLKIKLGTAPGNGVLRVNFTVKIKKRLRNAATINSLVSTLIIASSKQKVKAASPVTANLKFTAKGQNYLRGKSKVSATLDTRFAPVGGGSTSSFLQNFLLRKK